MKIRINTLIQFIVVSSLALPVGACGRHSTYTAGPAPVVVPPGPVPPGPSPAAPVSVTLTMTAPASTHPAALQFDVIYDPSKISLPAQNAALISSALSVPGIDKQLACNFALSSTSFRCVLWGLNSNVLPNGSVATLTLQPVQTASGQIPNIQFAGFIVSDATGSALGGATLTATTSASTSPIATATSQPAAPSTIPETFESYLVFANTSGTDAFSIQFEVDFDPTFFLPSTLANMPAAFLNVPLASSNSGFDLTCDFTSSLTSFSCLLESSTTPIPDGNIAVISLTATSLGAVNAPVVQISNLTISDGAGDPISPATLTTNFPTQRSQ